jgi:UDP-N-acetylmuramate--alanine ligase
VIPRAEMLAELMRLKYGIAIAGSHGKTTTTSLVSTVLSAAGLDPTVVIGGKLNAIGSNARAGDRRVARGRGRRERRELPQALAHRRGGHQHRPRAPRPLRLHAKLEDAFVEFAERVPFYGLAVLCLDHPRVQAILARIDRRHVTYGTNPQADYVASEPDFSGTTTSFACTAAARPRALRPCASPGPQRAQLPRDHRRRRRARHRPEVATRERSELRGRAAALHHRRRGRRITLVDDYGHHPAEVEATLSAAKAGFHRRVVAAFQPHRYSRTATSSRSSPAPSTSPTCWSSPRCTPRARAPIEGATGERLAEAIRATATAPCISSPTRHKVADRLEALVRPGDVVIALGAGDINQSVRTLYARLAANEASP